MGKFYPVAAPMLNGNERAYVLDCIDSTWISSKGSYIDKFEKSFSDFCSSKYALACSSGTTALHLALLAHGVGPGDEVIVPTLTFVATANAVIYCGAKPVFVDAQPRTWTLNPEHLEKLMTTRTKGIIVVHLYGHPVDMDPVMKIAAERGLFVLEDAAEAIGATYRSRPVGSIGHSAVFSLFGNKIITTGEGGIVTTNSPEVAHQVSILKGQGMDPDHRYWHPVIGYNYRMTNIQAAIGCAQLERVNWHIEQRKRVAQRYRQNLENDVRLTLPVEESWAQSVYWMFSVLIRDTDERGRDEMIQRLADSGVETRPIFYPMHVLPPYRSLQPDTEFPVATKVAATGINLPTHAGLTNDDVDEICEILEQVLSSSL